MDPVPPLSDDDAPVNVEAAETEAVDDERVIAFLSCLWAVDHGLQAVSKRMLATVGVTGPQRVVLRIVGREEGITPGGLARRIHDHPSTLTGVLQRLEAQGLLERTRDALDGRRVHLRLTPAGHALNAVRAGTVESAVRSAIGRVDPERLQAATDVLAVLTDELSRIVTPPVVPGPRSRRKKPAAT